MLRALAVAALALCALVFAPAARAEAPKVLIAVLEFRSALPEAERGKFGERLRYASQVRTQLGVKAPAAKVLTVDEMQRLAIANPDALNRCDDESCVAVGKLLGADLVIEGVFGKDARNGKELRATLRLFDVRKGGDPLASFVVAAATPEKLLAEVAGASSKLAARLPAAKR
jgi:hypothetical protein